jgi:hypothetical protein
MTDVSQDNAGSSEPNSQGQGTSPGTNAASATETEQPHGIRPQIAQAEHGEDEPEILAGVVGPSESATPERRESARAEPETRPAGDRKGRLRTWGPYQRWLWYRSARTESLDVWTDRDPDENQATKLPNNERLEIPGVWAVELYTPSTVAGLLDGIRGLGWEYGNFQDESLSKWMNDVRNGRTAGWKRLGLVSPRNNPHFMRDRTANLPPIAAGALPTLRSITPSITALVICFMLTDDAARSLDEPLRANYSTYVERNTLFRRRHVIPYVLLNRPIRLGGTYHTPAFQRRDAVEERLDTIERQCTTWLAEHFPGVFAQGLRHNLFPATMLMVSEETRLLTEDARQMRALDGTAMDQWYDSWTSNEWPGCYMTIPHGWRKEMLRLQFGCRRRDAYRGRSSDADEQSNWAISQHANDLIEGLTTRWALSCLLDGYHQQLSGHRDRAAIGAMFRPVCDLRQLRRFARTEAYDILMSAAEVASLASNRRAYAYNVIEMEHVRSTGKKRLDLLNELRSSQTRRSRQLERETQLLLSTLTTSTDVTQTISNIRIQRFLILLTAISIAIAVIAVVVAANAGS